MKLKQITLIILCAPLALSSCGPLIYSNFGSNVPLLREKGETALSGSLVQTMSADLSDDQLGFGLTGATAVAKNFGIAGSLSYSSGNSSDDWKRQSFYGEGAVGWFKAKEPKVVTEVYVGLGYGSIANSRSTESNYVNSRYFKPFVQPSLGFRFGYIDLGITAKIANVNVHASSNWVDNSMPDEFPRYLANVKNQIVFEPAFTFRVGRTVMLQYQLSYSSFPSGQYENYYCQNLFSSVGITARFNAKKS